VRQNLFSLQRIKELQQGLGDDLKFMTTKKRNVRKPSMEEESIGKRRE